MLYTAIDKQNHSAVDVLSELPAAADRPGVTVTHLLLRCWGFLDVGHAWGVQEEGVWYSISAPLLSLPAVNELGFDAVFRLVRAAVAAGDHPAMFELCKLPVAAQLGLNQAQGPFAAALKSKGCMPDMFEALKLLSACEGVPTSDLCELLEMCLFSGCGADESLPYASGMAAAAAKNHEGEAIMLHLGAGLLGLPAANNLPKSDVQKLLQLVVQQRVGQQVRDALLQLQFGLGEPKKW